MGTIRVAWVYLALSAALWPGPAPARAAETLRLGVCLSLTGELRIQGLPDFAGVAIRRDELNARAGQDGPKVELVVRDTKSDGATAARMIEELAVQENVHVVIGPCSSDMADAMHEAARKHRVILISPSVTKPGLSRRGDMIFPISNGDDQQAKALAAFLARRTGGKRVAVILNSANAYSRNFADCFAKAHAENGGQIVATETYAIARDEAYGHDFRVILNRVKQMQPDAVLLPNYYEEVAAIVSQSYSVGMKTRFCGGDSWGHESILYASGNNIGGAVYTSHFDPASTAPAMRAFLEQLNRSNDVNANLSSVAGYDALTLAVEIAADGGDTDQLLQRLYTPRGFALASGNLRFDAERGAFKTLFICEVTRHGDTFEARAVETVEP